MIFFLVLFISVTAYYEYKLNKLLHQKNLDDEKINQMTSLLISSKLNETNEAASTALIDKAILEEKYNDLASEYEILQKEKEALKDEITLLKSQVEYHQVKIDGPVAQFRLIQNKNSEIGELKERISALCSKLKPQNISHEEC